MHLELAIVTLDYSIDHQTWYGQIQTPIINRISSIEFKPSELTKPDSSLNLSLDIGRILATPYIISDEDDFFSLISDTIFMFLEDEFPNIGFKEGVIVKTVLTRKNNETIGKVTIRFERDSLCIALPRI